MFFALVAATSLLATPAQGAPAAPLAERADAAIARLAPAESHVGVSAVDLATGEVVYQHQAHKVFTPASLVKLATSGAALSYLGVQRRFATKLLVDGPADGGIVRGALYLRGEGNPMLTAEGLDELARKLRAQGVKTVTGDVVADAGYFAPDGPGAPGWAWDDLAEPYGAPLSALSLNRNVGTVAMASAPAPGGAPRLAVTEPARAAAVALKAALGRHGIQVHGDIRLGATPSGARTVAIHQSPPLAEIVRLMNKDSDNLIAETLVYHVGVRGHGAPGTREKGLRTLKSFLEHVGWEGTGFRLEDGSGLSTYDALSPAQLTGLLRAMPAETLAYGAYLISLPVGGVDGTLARRLESPVVRGRLRAKTGTMSGVSGLAGYMVTDAGRTLAVAIMVNGFVGPAQRARELQDALVEVLAGADAGQP